MSAAAGAGRSPPAPADPPVPAAACFGLVLLTCASAFNFLDRQILSILSQSIKADLKLTDADLGFLLGASFVVFYAIVGIAMGRIADRVSRRKLMAAGLALWSGMTVLGGGVTSFAGLAAVRMGVGVGEATSTPCTHSLTAELFPPRHRAKAMAGISAGSYIGAAVAMIVGGLLLEHWAGLCGRVPFGDACAIRPWQAVLIVVGLPGLLLAPLVLLIREPAAPRARATWRDVLYEIACTLPPLTLVSVHRAGGMPALRRNLGIGAAIALAALVLRAVTGDSVQWIAIGIGAYAIFTWGQMQRLNDPPLYALTFGCPTYAMAMVAGALLGSISGTLNAWAAPYMMRTFAVGAGSVGVSLGLTQCLAGVTGVVLGGWLGDRWRRRDGGAPMWLAMVTLLCEVPLLLALLLAPDLRAFVAVYVCFCVVSSLYVAPLAAMVQDLVLPRMRGAAASAFALVSTVIAMGAGPYLAGKISTLTGSLQTGLSSILVMAPFALTLLLLAGRRLRGAAPETRHARAVLAGEAA